MRERLQEQGALDVSLLPAAMKKDRPGYLLRVVCRREQKDQLEEIIFRETTTIGIRSFPAGRRVLERRLEQVQVAGLPVTVKVCRLGEEEFCYPEYEDVRRAAKELETPWRAVYASAQAEGGRLLQGEGHNHGQ